VCSLKFTTAKKSAARYLNPLYWTLPKKSLILFVSKKYPRFINNTSHIPFKHNPFIKNVTPVSLQQYSLGSKPGLPVLSCDPQVKEVWEPVAIFYE
jgi:hypothetical protein